VQLLGDPIFLALAFAIAGLVVAGWWYRRRKKRPEMSKIPASDITRPGTTAAPPPIPSKKHTYTPREVLKRALRRGDKALGTNIEDSSLPFLDTSPLTHRDPDQAEINTFAGKPPVRNAPSDRQNQIRGP
jgi:hypothetical protein